LINSLKGFSKKNGRKSRIKCLEGLGDLGEAEGSN